MAAMISAGRRGGTGEHVVGIGQIGEGRLDRKHLLLRDAQPSHVGPVDLHLPAQNCVHIGGEGPHQAGIPGLHHTVGEHPGVVEQVQIVLQQEPLELLQVQTAVSNPPDKGMVMALLPDGMGGLVQPLCRSHSYSSYPMAGPPPCKKAGSPLGHPAFAPILSLPCGRDSARIACAASLRWHYPHQVRSRDRPLISASSRKLPCTFYYKSPSSFCQ